MKLSKGAARLPQSERNAEALEALLQLSADTDADQSPHASEFHSDKIIEMMMDFMKKFKSQKNEVDEMESKEKHDFDMAQGARKNQIKALEDTVKEEEGKVWDQRSTTRAAELTALSK